MSKSKSPNEDYIIRIKSSVEQFESNGSASEEEADRIELMTRGSLVKKGSSYYISYKETQTIGFEGCTTTIKIAEDGSRVALLRFGKVNTQLVIQRDYHFNICRWRSAPPRRPCTRPGTGRLSARTRPARH